MKGYRLLQGEEIDALYDAAREAIESLRDTRNNTLTLGAITEDGLEAIKCPLEGVNAVDDIGAWTHVLRKNFKGAKLAQQSMPNGTVRYILVLPKYVEDTEAAGGGGYASAGAGANGLIKPSTDRALLLVVILAVLVGVLRMYL